MIIKIRNTIMSFFSRYKKYIFSFGALFMLTFMIKRGVYDHIIPSSDILAMIQRKEMTKIILGSVMMLGYSKVGGYAVTSHKLLDPKDLMPALKESGTTYTSLIINEEHVAFMVAFGIYSYVCYKAFFYLKDMHGYKGKE